jgi:hypothetical protein
MTHPTDPPGDTPPRQKADVGTLPRRWACLSCSWSSQRIPDHIVFAWHQCRPDGVRRRIVQLNRHDLDGENSSPRKTPLDDDSAQDRRRAESREWFLKTYPTPNPPVAAGEPRPATPPRAEEPTR